MDRTAILFSGNGPCFRRRAVALCGKGPCIRRRAMVPNGKDPCIRGRAMVLGGNGPHFQQHWKAEKEYPSDWLDKMFTCRPRA